MMRKKLWLITLISVLTSFSFLSVAQEEQSSKAPCDKYETTADMRNCLEQRYEAADKALNEVYKQLRSKLSKKCQTQLKETQLWWIKFRDLSAAFEASEAEGGSMYPLVYNSVLRTITEKRVEELKKRLKKMPSEN
ncbi:MAG: hypothetical protein DRR19_17845 [Candidatus Parabeggiatoa sp. nov. 1]|nr:MAG: hypothetical protein DRR19_17845 [Gammaproteobacteria bacterium]